MTFLLDTSTVSDYFRRVGHTHEWMHAHAPDELAISTITEHELCFGLALKPGASRLAREVMSFLQTVDVLPFDRHDAASAADVRARLSKRGEQIGDFARSSRASRSLEIACLPPQMRSNSVASRVSSSRIGAAERETLAQGRTFFTNVRLP